MSLVLLCLALIGFAYAAPPIAVVKDTSCIDGVNNVVEIADVNDAALSIHSKGIVAQTYDANGKPSCYYGRAAVALPGQIKLVRGSVVVSASNNDIKKAEVKLTLSKNSWFVGTVCENGVSKKGSVPPDACHHRIYPEIGDKFLEMINTPGTYDLEQIEREAHQSNIIKLPAIAGTLNMIVKGDWHAEIALVIGNKPMIAHIKVPSNTPWIYVT